MDKTHYFLISPLGRWEKRSYLRYNATWLDGKRNRESEVESETKNENKNKMNKKISNEIEG